MRIDASGNVGIGTTNPTKRLTVVGPALNGAGNEALWVDANTVQFAVRRESSGGGTVEIGTPNNHNLGIFTNGTRVMSIDANGNVGIGGTPSAKLDIFGATSASYTALRISNPSGVEVQIDANGTSDSSYRVLSNHPFTIHTNSAERFRVKTTGQVRFAPRSGNPSGAETGDVYYDSSDNKLKVYNGTSWVNLH